MDQQHASERKLQGSGIRQGCPLSPYLFVICLSVLLSDVNTHLRAELFAEDISNPYHIFSANTPLLHLEYADDILIFSRSTRIMQAVLNILEREAAFYGMELNEKKTIRHNMRADNPAPVFFRTRRPNPDSPPTPVPTRTSARYLGLLISNTGKVRSHLNQKLSTTRTQFGKVQRLWSHSWLPIKFKLNISKGIFQIWLCTHCTMNCYNALTVISSMLGTLNC